MRACGRATIVTDIFRQNVTDTFRHYVTDIFRQIVTDIFRQKLSNGCMPALADVALNSICMWLHCVLLPYNIGGQPHALSVVHHPLECAQANLVCITLYPPSVIMHLQLSPLLLLYGTYNTALVSNCTHIHDRVQTPVLIS